MKPCGLLDLSQGITVHAGAPCEDKDCPFRTPPPRPSLRQGNAIADFFREASALARAELRAALRLDPMPPRSLGPANDSRPRAARFRPEVAPVESGNFCRAYRCKDAIKPGLVMCVAHWAMVVRPLRNAIWTYPTDSTEYAEAIHAAIEAVRALEEPAQKSLF
jgi:hypothetical protein